ncbi:Ig-like domain-containing protein [Anaeromicropila herbilytica]|uniref:2',3'-cyclic-nucleotide 2'-phosphodiesterase n=1 Tax=Anaeromicropila herbilytica TaxID=2785025 RepID=A0A7R7EP53_9FIRM|nr:Ig-like domain-containing protein [Anaeromicropila herbilytica]BCN32206.1 hypothetical protein bsdtb5_35010 [Anaeromicropila herbilytica]
MNKKPSRIKQIIKYATIAVLISFVFARTNDSSSMTTVKAASDDKVDLRLIFTSDTHGQINSKDYETGGSYNSGGLAKAYSLIEEARQEKQDENTFTFDIGDNLFDFTTEYIFADNQKELQPIYEAIAKVGYDAITLGNHDFDYGYDYIKYQLEQSGLKDNVVVSNLWETKTDKHPFHENMIITRNAYTQNGDRVKIKVGIIGETIPKLSTKTENYTGTLSTEDLVINVKAQAKKLKAKGADVIVVLAHSGFGAEKPEEGDNNESYALTKIKDVDVVLCGHEHNMFPNSNHSMKYYKLSGVDADTGLVNGKNLVMSADRGQSIGVVDLSLKKKGSSFDITSRSSEVRRVKSSTYENNDIASTFGKWANILGDYYEKTIATIDSTRKITDFFGLVQDNTGIQLMNNAKMAYALNYVNNINTKYKDYNIIAASNYIKYGQNSYKDFVNLSGKITEADLACMQKYNKYIALYSITGEQLREWLEWSASAYENIEQQSPWTGKDMWDVMKEFNTASLLKSDWLKSWVNFTVFDGVEYTIDPSANARYDKAGNKISDSYRVVNLTYNGTTVTNGMRFLLATDLLDVTSEANRGIDKQSVKKGYNRSQVVISDYVKMLAKNGAVQISPDYNWKLKINANNQYIVMASSLSDSIASNYPWYVKKLDTIHNYNYYLARGTYTILDTTPPNIVAMPLNLVPTNQDVTVAVQANDESGVTKLKYALGNHDINDDIWREALDVTNGTFTVNLNGTYSILAEDQQGNCNITMVTIDNINRDILQNPKVDTYTNRKTKITGTAEPLANIYFETDNKTYQGTVAADGTFSYPLPAQLANTTLNVYVKDSAGRSSQKTEVKVKSTGPNCPTVNQFTNKVTSITGNTRDEAVYMYAVIGKNAYVAKDGGADILQNSEKYDNSLDIYETSVKVDKDGTYNIKVPIQLPGTKIAVYSVDKLNRVSRVNTVTTKDVAPNPPKIYEVTNIERKVYGYVRNTSKEARIYDIEVEINGDVFYGQTDDKGYYAVPVSKLAIGDKVTVKAIDNVGGETRTSYPMSKKVQNIENYYMNTDDSIILDDINNKQYAVSGQYYDGEDNVFVSINKHVYEVPTDTDGNFELELSKTLAAGTPIYVYSRYVDGGIIEADRFTVALARPDEPTITRSEITTATNTLRIMTDKNCTVVAKVGSMTYQTAKYKYDSDLGAYVYTIKFAKHNSGTEVRIYAKNKAGSSSSYYSNIVKTAPNQPKVNAIHEKSKVITGKVDIVPLTDSDGEQVTKVYAKIGGKTYVGKVSEDGTFKIKIPAQKKNTKIYVWGGNISGKGPARVVKVQ